jgi:ketosteroid isomerase-like protein
MVDAVTTLERYYALVDSGDLDAAMELLHPDASFAIVLPGGGVRGESRDGIRAYLDGRGPVVRRHVPMRRSIDGDLEFVYGSVLEDETTTTGHFLAAARVVDGRITGYQVSFDPDLVLLPA